MNNEDLINAKLNLQAAMIEYMRKVRNSEFSIIEAGDKCLIRADYVAGESNNQGSIDSFQVTLTHSNKQ